jgi:succinoglycan biosynthesis transport protein ExoP
MQPRPIHIDAALVSLKDPDSFTAEQYQGLRLKIEELQRSTGARLLGVSSPGEGDGKTVTAINLAAALARGATARVLLIDADLRRPRIATLLDIDTSRPGLSDAVTADDMTLAEVAQPCPGIALDVVHAGSLAAPVHDVLRSSRLSDRLQEARDLYDFVIVDTPPLVPVFDSALLARSIDAMLIVVAAHRTPRTLLEESLTLLDPAKVAGIVFNRDDRTLAARYEGRYRKYFSRKAA